MGGEKSRVQTTKMTLVHQYCKKPYRAGGKKKGKELWDISLVEGSNKSSGKSQW